MAPPAQHRFGTRARTKAMAEENALKVERLERSEERRVGKEC